MSANQDSMAELAPRIICKNCKGNNIQIHNPIDNIQVDYDSTSDLNKCLRWLETFDIDSEEGSICSSTDVSSTTDSQSTKDYENEDTSLILHDSTTYTTESEDLRPLKSKQCSGNMQLSSCNGVVIGKFTNIRGPVYITQTNSIINKQTVKNQIFLEGTAVTIPRKLYIMNRRSWLAQPPVADKEYLEQPAKYVTICHTATEDAITQAGNIELVRTIQSVHIEGKKWGDIAYNFLVGCDGNVYEGRGWNIVGSHTNGYNNNSVGIAFVGCFINKLPPNSVIDQAKALIKLGVENGFIDKNYFLFSQCDSTSLFYKEIKTWDNWHSIEGFK